MTSTATTYCVFIDTLCEGPTPAIRDADDKPVVFATRREAEQEIADTLITRLQEFIDGERDFEDAMTVEDYIVEVIPLPDGSIIDKAGNWYGSRRLPVRNAGGDDLAVPPAWNHGMEAALADVWEAGFRLSQVKLAVFVDGCFWHQCQKHSNVPAVGCFRT